MKLGNGVKTKNTHFDGRKWEMINRENLTMYD